jgi:hypothetical protein
LTREKSEKVKMGMTLREVEAILKPAQKRRRDACTWFRCDNPNVLGRQASSSARMRWYPFRLSAEPNGPR